MTVYFNRDLPLFLSSEPNYNGIAVDVSDKYLQLIEDIRVVIQAVDVEITNTGSPEDYNQSLADIFVEGLQEILDEYTELAERNCVRRLEAAANIESQLDTSPSVPTEGD